MSDLCSATSYFIFYHKRRLLLGSHDFAYKEREGVDQVRMDTGVYERRFGRVLSKILDSNDISCYKISQYANLDGAYLSRLRNGLKDNPSPEVVIRIGLALVHHSNKIRMSDIEKLFNATGRTLFPKNRGY